MNYTHPSKQSKTTLSKNDSPLYFHMRQKQEQTSTSAYYNIPRAIHTALGTLQQTLNI